MTGTTGFSPKHSSQDQNFLQITATHLKTHSQVSSRVILTRVYPGFLLENPCFLWSTEESILANRHLRQKKLENPYKSQILKYKFQIVPKILTLWYPDHPIQVVYKGLSTPWAWSWPCLVLGTVCRINVLLTGNVQQDTERGWLKKILLHSWWNHGSYSLPKCWKMEYWF